MSNSEKTAKAYLKDFGLNDKETTIYLALLKHGPSTIMDLSRKTGIKRSTTHNNVEELIKKGLVSQTNYGERRMVIAEDPEKLKFLLDQRKWEVNKLEKSMSDIVTALYDAVPKAKENSKVEVKYYDGAPGVRLIYADALKSKEVRSYVNLEQVIKHLPDNGELFIEAQKKNKDMILLEIMEDSPVSRNLVDQFARNPHYKYKFAPKTFPITAVDVLIYNNEVAIISLGDNGNISGTVMTNPNYSDHMKAVFDFVWNTMK